jgi:CheY-like chemotaxis protein
VLSCVCRNGCIGADDVHSLLFRPDGCSGPSKELPLRNDPPALLCNHRCIMNSVIDRRTGVLNSEHEGVAAASVRVLLVDDFEPCRDLVSLILKQQAGYEIIAEVGNGLEAVQKAEELKPDLVVLDVGLPELNGIEVARRIVRCSPGTTILFLTGNHDTEVAREALRAGAQGYVHKFDLVVELGLAVKAVLSGKQFLSRRLRNRDLIQNRCL